MRPYFYEALSATCEPRVLLVVALSAAYGILIGSIPGLTATMAVALLVPMTFFLDSVSAASSRSSNGVPSGPKGLAQAR
ncbi:MAG: tripartite tricarboxylate transporter permease, partial [Planctomycetales bacterium]|nr:tripartite tricarboxylate transporter permease [Planctomycetales bacterium]